MQQPVTIPELSKFVEFGVEIPKATLIERIAGKVRYEVLQMIKAFIFHHAEKDKKGNVMLV